MLIYTRGLDRGSSRVCYGVRRRCRWDLADELAKLARVLLLVVVVVEVKVRRGSRLQWLGWRRWGVREHGFIGGASEHGAPCAREQGGGGGRWWWEW